MCVRSIVAFNLEKYQVSWLKTQDEILNFFCNMGSAPTNPWTWFPTWFFYFIFNFLWYTVIVSLTQPYVINIYIWVCCLGRVQFLLPLNLNTEATIKLLIKYTFVINVHQQGHQQWGKTIKTSTMTMVVVLNSVLLLLPSFSY